MISGMVDTIEHNPGSPETIAQGCTCSPEHNNHGEGMMFNGRSGATGPQWSMRSSTMAIGLFCYRLTWISVGTTYANALLSTSVVHDNAIVSSGRARDQIQFIL